MRLLLLSLLLLFQFGCDEVMEVDMSDGHTPKLVVSSYISDGKQPDIYVTLTQPAYSQSTQMVEEGLATIEDLSAGLLYTLDAEIGYGYTKYTSDAFTFKQNQLYRLSVDYADLGEVLSAIDSIPSPPVISGLSVVPVKDDFPYSVTVQMNSQSKGFYEIVLYLAEGEGNLADYGAAPTPLSSNSHYITREDYYPSLIMVDGRHPESLLFRTGSEKKIAIDFFYETSFSWNPIRGYRFPEHTVNVMVRRVSEAYFNYKTTLYKQGYAIGGDFLYGIAPPVTVQSNVNGGFGIFAAYSQSDTTTHIEARSFTK